VRSLARTHQDTLASLRRAQQSLKRLRGQESSAATQMRKSLRRTMATHRALSSVRLGSFRQLRDCWDAATRHRSLAAVEAVRQVVRGATARVYLKLTYLDGTIVRDSEPLVLRRGRWFLG